MVIGAKIKELRIQKGLTQEELADRAELSKLLLPLPLLWTFCNVLVLI